MSTVNHPPSLPEQVSAWIIAQSQSEDTLLLPNKIEGLSLRKLNPSDSSSHHLTWAKKATRTEAVIRIIGELGFSQLGPYGDIESVPRKFIDEAKVRGARFRFTCRYPFEENFVPKNVRLLCRQQFKNLAELVRVTEGDPTFKEQLEGASVTRKPKNFNPFVTEPTDDSWEIKFAAPRIFKAGDDNGRGQSGKPGLNLFAVEDADAIENEGKPQVNEPSSSNSLNRMTAWPDPEEKYDFLDQRKNSYVINNELKAYDISGKPVHPKDFVDVFVPGAIAVFDAKPKVWDMTKITGDSITGSKTYQLSLEQVRVIHVPNLETLSERPNKRTFEQISDKTPLLPSAPRPIDFEYVVETPPEKKNRVSVESFLDPMAGVSLSSGVSASSPSKSNGENGGKASKKGKKKQNDLSSKNTTMDSIMEEAMEE